MYQSKMLDRINIAWLSRSNLLNLNCKIKHTWIIYIKDNGKYDRMIWQWVLDLIFSSQKNIRSQGFVSIGISQAHIFGRKRNVWKSLRLGNKMNTTLTSFSPDRTSSNARSLVPSFKSFIKSSILNGGVLWKKTRINAFNLMDEHGDISDLFNV